MRRQTIQEILFNILKTQKFAVIATQDKKSPYLNLVSYVSTKNNRNIVFATSKKTQKYENITKKSEIAILIDNRDNTESDIENAVVINGIGNASEIRRQTDYYKKLYLKKHPYLTDFVNSEDTIFINIQIKKYIIVTEFEKINTIEFKKND